MGSADALCGIVTRAVLDDEDLQQVWGPHHLAESRDRLDGVGRASEVHEDYGHDTRSHLDHEPPSPRSAQASHFTNASPHSAASQSRCPRIATATPGRCSPWIPIAYRKIPPSAHAFFFPS